MERLDIGIAGEVGDVECHDTPDIPGLHHGDETGVMNLHAQHSVLYEELAPQGERGHQIRQDRKEPLHLIDVAAGSFHAQAETIDTNWPGAHIPKFGYVLCR